MKKKRALALLMAMATAATVAGCGKKNEATSSGAKLSPGEVSYPLKDVGDQKLTIWNVLDGGVSQVAASENETELTKWLREETGINVEFNHPPAGQADEKFNLMLASGEFPDIMVYALSKTKEGAETLVKNGYIHRLDKDFLKGYAPNYYKILEENKELKKSAMLNDGTFYGFSHWRENDNMTVYSGLMIRQDWLDELGLQSPETIDDWYNVLTAFKEKKGAKAPFTTFGTAPFTAGAFTGAYNTTLNFYVRNGKITHGVLDDSFKDFLTCMKKWYDEGLIDSDFASADKEQVDTKMLNGKSGATYGMIGSGMGSLISAAPDKKYKITAALYPSLKKGEISEFGAKDSCYYEPDYLISGTSKNKELAARYLDYGYTKAGKLLYNFGKEGVSYDMIDGYPTFNDLIYKNKDGLSATQALCKYTHCTFMGPFEFDERFFKQQYMYQEQKEAIDIWAKTNAKDHIIVDYNAATTDEQSEIGKYLADINIHISENVTKFIMGIRSMDEYDSFIKELKDLNIDKVIELKQKAYDRYEERK